MQKKEKCPLPGACNQEGVVYQASVKNMRGEEETYIGLAKNFKKRYYGHTKTFKEKPEKSTTLSTHFWKEREKGGEPVVAWKILEKNIPTFNPVSGKCQLCLREKFNIVLNPHLGTLNSRQEIFSHCRHKRFMLINKPPD